MSSFVQARRSEAKYAGLAIARHLSEPGAQACQRCDECSHVTFRGLSGRKIALKGVPDARQVGVTSPDR
jgi:Na+-translocating ferredoxin:NAD+ oxidoreductase RnfC subunit